MRTAIMCGALTALTITPTTAGAQEDRDSANHLMPGCQAALNNTAHDLAAYCMGIVDGIAYTAALSSPDDIVLHPWGKNKCLSIPSEVTIFQMARVVVAYIEERPQRMHESFYGLAIEALHDAWPCRK